MATRRRKSTAHARRATSRRKSASHIAGQNILFQKLQQAKRAERNAIRKMGVLVRRHQQAIEKMRKTIQMRIAEKTREIARHRKQLAKKYAVTVQKLRRKHIMHVKQLRKQFSSMHRSLNKGQASKKRAHRAKSRKAYGKKAYNKQVVAFKRPSRSSFRRAA